MQYFTIFLALVVCATLVWITEATEAEECKSGQDYLSCGDKCHGSRNTCKCGNQSWKGANKEQGCCPSSPDSCIKDNDGKTRHKKFNQFFILLIFTGNVACEEGLVLSLRRGQCPILGQCFSIESYKSRPICEDPKTSEKFCPEKKSAEHICRGIPNVACKE